MDGGAADEGDPRLDLRLEPDVLEHRPHSPPRQEMASPPIPGDLLVDIFLRLPDPADLIRAAACVSFRRLVADRYFLRQYRKLHAPPLLGFIEVKGEFHRASPHPSAPAAVALAADFSFSFSFLPAPASDWVVEDSRDGRVLLHRSPKNNIFPELVVCDPLHRRYLLLPPIPDNPLLIEQYLHSETFLGPAETSAADETSFSVIWMVKCRTKLVSFIFSSSTGNWRANSSSSWSDLFAGWLSSTEEPHFFARQYAYGCFYWMNEYGGEAKLLVLDIGTMKFSIADAPLEAKDSCDFAMVEAGEGITGMFLLADGTSDISYFIRKNDGRSSGQWQKGKTITLGSWVFLLGNKEKHLLFCQGQRSLLRAGCFMLDIETFQLEKVCALESDTYKVYPYSNFPPSLSSPTISSGVEDRADKDMLEQGCVASSSAQSARSE